MACRPEAPDLKRLPRVEVPFTGITDGSNPTATPVPEPVEPGPPPDEVVEDLPDPAAELHSLFVEYELQFSHGTVSVLSSKRFRTAQPTAADRMMGRFAFELFVGHTLLERVRFDFPLLGASTRKGQDPLEQGLTAQARVVVPLHERATVARVLDRKTRKVYPVPWPPRQQSAETSAGAVPPEVSEEPEEESERHGDRAPADPGGSDIATSSGAGETR